MFQAIECFGHTFYTFCRPKDSNSGIHLSLRRPHQVRFAIGLLLNCQKWPILDPTDTKRTCCGRHSRNQMPELGSLGDSASRRLCQTSSFALACRSYLTSSTFRHIMTHVCIREAVAACSSYRSIYWRFYALLLELPIKPYLGVAGASYTEPAGP